LFRNFQEEVASLVTTIFLSSRIADMVFKLFESEEYKLTRDVGYWESQMINDFVMNKLKFFSILSPKGKKTEMFFFFQTITVVF
jgi:hypothetical protein